MNAEFNRLWQEFVDGGLGAAGFRRLDQMFRDDPALVRHAADLYEEHRLLGLALRMEDAERFASQMLGRLEREREVFAVRLCERLEVPATDASQSAKERERVINSIRSEGAARKPASVLRWSAGGLLAACGLAAAVVVALTPSFQARPARPASAPANVATLLWAENARWNSRVAPMREGERIGTGRIELESGSAVVQFDSGAIAVLSGPAAMQLKSRGSARLHHGQVTVRAPEGAAGFTLHTPASDVTDLGTEFAVKVEATGATEVHVIEGEVEYRRPAAGLRVAKLLTGGHAVRFDAPAGGDERSVELAAFSVDELVSQMQKGASPGKLLAYEGFDYMTGSLAASGGGGSGWAGPWRSLAGAETRGSAETSRDLTVAPASLSRPGLTHSQGGSLEFPVGMGFRARPMSSPIDLGKDAVYYVSVLLNQEARRPFQKTLVDVARLTFRSSANFWGGSIEFTMRNMLRPQIGYGRGNMFNSSQAFPTDETLLLVWKISAKAKGEDEMFLKIYAVDDPVDVFEPAEWTVATRGVFSDAQFDLLVLRGGGHSRRWMDEIRIGTSWDQVVPGLKTTRAVGLPKNRAAL